MSRLRSGCSTSSGGRSPTRAAGSTSACATSAGLRIALAQWRVWLVQALEEAGADGGDDAALAGETMGAVDRLLEQLPAR